MGRTRGLWGIPAVVAALVLAAPVRAEESPPAAPAGAEASAPAFTIGAKPGWFVLGGVTTGGTVVTTDRGGYLGGELSITRIRDGRFYGLYADGYYDFGLQGTYVTAGPELGYKFLGVDGGVAARLGGARAEWGPTGRLFVSVGLLAIYARYAYFVDALRPGNEHVVQIGALVKVPFAAWGGK